MSSATTGLLASGPPAVRAGVRSAQPEGAVQGGAQQPQATYGQRPDVTKRSDAPPSRSDSMVLQLQVDPRFWQIGDGDGDDPPDSGKSELVGDGDGDDPPDSGKSGWRAQWDPRARARARPRSNRGWARPGDGLRVFGDRGVRALSHGGLGPPRATSPSAHGSSVSGVPCRPPPPARRYPLASSS